MSDDFSSVRLELDSRPEAPALVRAALAGVAGVVEVDPELFDDLKTAVSEACNNVVLHAYEGRPGPFVVALGIRPGAIEATIRDWGGGIQHVGPSEERMGVGLAVISALADRAEFVSAPDGGTEVRIAFTDRGDDIRPLERSAGANPSIPVRLAGDVVVTVSPAGLLAGVLGRVARAVAARTHLSLDRFSDIYLVADAISAVAESAARAADITFAVAASHRRLELAVAPFQAGHGARLLEESLMNRAGAVLVPAVGELVWEPLDDYELLRVVVEDRADTPVG